MAPLLQQLVFSLVLALGGVSANSIATGTSCYQYPAPPVNSAIRCTGYSSCVATCRTQYEFPSGETRLTLTCQSGTWATAAGAAVPDCMPVCSPRCQNGGLCVGPNQCVCRQSFGGSYCQTPQVVCKDMPPIPYNSRRSCTSRSCTIQCFAEHRFPDGSNSVTLTCETRGWTAANRTWTTVPDCEAICNPPCQNGGRCLVGNQCVCSGDFKGAQCQHECNGTPPVPMNSMLRCSASGSCRATCIEKHRFPGGSSELTISCQAEGWLTDGTRLSTVPDCLPVCFPACRNNGVCMAPNTCSCPENFSGPICEREDRPCPAFPRTPANSFKTCNSRRCVMQCAPDFQFPDGSTSQVVTCHNGVWRPNNPAWLNGVPNCA